MNKLKAIICVLLGHSRIITQCFGYIHCARCEAQIGDTLGGVFDAKTCVILYHDCETCREAAKSLTWRDRLLVPNPFNPKKIAEEQETYKRARAAFDALGAKQSRGSPT